MTLNLKKSLLNNLTLKVFSLFFAYTFWFIFSQSRTISVWLDVPLSFYTHNNNHSIECPEKVQVNLSGKRADFQTLDMHTLAAHIDSRELSPGENHIPLNEKKLFLPETIKLVNYCPSNITITLHETSLT